MAGRSGVKLPPLSTRPLGWVFPHGHQQPVLLEAHRGQGCLGRSAPPPSLGFKGHGSSPETGVWITARVEGRQCRRARQPTPQPRGGGPCQALLTAAGLPSSPGLPGNQGRWEKPLTAGQSHSPGQPCPPWTVSQETPPSGGCWSPERQPLVIPRRLGGSLAVHSHS